MENSGRKSVCVLKALQEKVQAFLNAIQEWKSIEVPNPLIDPNFSSIKMFVNMVLKNGQSVIIIEIIVY